MPEAWAKAVGMAKEYAPFVRKVEVEVETLDQLEEALAAGADIIMLDNMDLETMRKAVEITAGRAELECSGNVTKQRLKEIAAIGVDYVFRRNADLRRAFDGHFLEKLKALQVK